MSDLNDYQIIKVGDLPVAETLEGLNILGFDSTNNRAVRALMALLKGLDGKPVELQKTATHLQWRIEGGSWANLLALDEVKGAKGDPNTLSIGTVQGGTNAGATITGTAPNQILNLTLPKGDTGSNIELQKTTTHVQWRVVGGTWANLIPLSDLKGEQGDNISMQKTATHIQWRLGTGAWTNLVPLTELKGDTGANIELQKSATHVQWRVQGTTTWNNLIPLEDLKVKGDTGANIELQKSTTHVQWRVQGTTTWTNLIPLSDLKGEKGDAPIKGVDYFDGKNPVVLIGTITTVASNAQADATIEPDGVDAEGKPKFKLNLWLPKGVDGEGAGDMLKSVYDPTGKNADVFGYVDNKVKTDVPTNAKFTDTTYDEITETEINTGTASDLRTITARRITYILNKVQALINSAISALTKSSVGLENVDNIQQATKTEFNAHKTDGATHSDIRSEVASVRLVAEGAVVAFAFDTVAAMNTWIAVPANKGKLRVGSPLYIRATNVPDYWWDGTQVLMVEGEKVDLTGYMLTSVANNTFVAKESGKSLMTDTERTKLSGIANNAQKNSDITKAEIEAKLIGAITSHTHAYVPTSSFAGSTFTANVIPLDNPLGSFRVATASNVATYTLSTTKVIGAWAKILVNRATAPTVTGGALIKGSDFKASTNMYLYVSYDGTKSEYYFAEI